MNFWIDNYKNIWCDRNIHGGGVACYVRNELNYNIISVFPREKESVFFEILLLNSKPIIAETTTKFFNNQIFVSEKWKHDPIVMKFTQNLRLILNFSRQVRKFSFILS